MERRRDRAGKQSRRSRWPCESERVLGTSKSSREADEPASRASGVKTPAGSRLGARKWRQPSRNAPTGAGLPGDAPPPEPGGGGSAWSGAGQVRRSCVKPASNQEDEAPSRGDAHLQESPRWKPKLAEAETLTAGAQVPGRQPGRPPRGAHQRGEPASRVTGLGQEIRIRPLLASCTAPGGWVPSVWGGPTAGSGEAGLENTVSGARASGRAWNRSDASETQSRRLQLGGGPAVHGSRRLHPDDEKCHPSRTRTGRPQEVLVASAWTVAPLLRNEATKGVTLAGCPDPTSLLVEVLVCCGLNVSPRFTC